MAEFKKGKRALVVVESPAKAKTIKKYLGSQFQVLASVGHVKDLPKNVLAVDISQNFKPHYEIIYGKAKIIKEIKEAAKNADVIYLASDPDREGEAIAFHIAEELASKQRQQTYRIIFNEITRHAVDQAIQNPLPLNQHKYNSQQARRILDRLVGYQISPILWEKVRRGLSAGRVQSVAVRLITEREQAIKAFVCEEFWKVKCLLTPVDRLTPFIAEVVQENGQRFRPSNEQQAQICVARLQKAHFAITKIVPKMRRRRPNPPLITSKLQQEASTRLHFTSKRTMLVAQQLYEGVDLGPEGQTALITYMRTDSTRISAEALTTVRSHIQQVYGNAYLPATPNLFKNKKNAQDAHEAVRPTSLNYPPMQVKAYLSAEQFKLYQLIWQSFIACQMIDAVYAQTQVEIAAATYQLRAHGSVLQEPGFLLAFADSETTDNPAATELETNPSGHQDKQLPKLVAQEALKCQKTTPEQHFTQPPPRFSESGLVKELEEKGIGRPSTYATILSTIVTRGYVTKDAGKFTPTELGLLITELLIAAFPQVLDVAFTAHIEEQLDAIETGNVNWVTLLHDFYHGGFDQALLRAKETMRDVKSEAIVTEHLCTLCNAKMIIKWGRNGSFLACSNYPKCRNTQDFIREEDGRIVLVEERISNETCPLCQGAMLFKRGRYGQFLACRTYPECKGTRPISIGINCPHQCGGYAVERKSKRGRIFYGCSRYPKCDFVTWDKPVTGTCPNCQHHYLIRKISKKQGTLIKCPQKGCGYSRDPELDDQDTHVYLT